MKRAAAGGGFTLIEVMVALALLSVVMLGLVALQVVVINANAGARQMSAASALAQDRMEQLTGVATPVAGVEPNLNERGQPATTGVLFTRTTSVSTGPLGERVFQVRVDWSEDGRAHSVTFAGQRL